MSRKIVSLSLALTTTLWLVAPVLPVAASSAQDQINSLLQQIAALQGQLNNVQSGGAGSLTKALKFGMTDPEVKILQTGLAMDASVYPAGIKSGYFGGLTKAAVIKFQEKYAADVLAPNGLSKGTGFVGASTRAKFNALYAVAPSVSPRPSGSPVVSGSPSVSASPAPAGALNISLDSSSMGGTAVADTTSGDGAQARAKVLKIHFTGNGKVTQIRIHRIGISTDSDFSNAYLYDGDSDNKLAESPSVSGGYFTFTNSSGLFTVSGDKVVAFAVDLANGTASGKTFQFGVMATTDVVSDAASVGGSVPFHAPEWRTASVSDLGKLTLTNVSPAADNSVDPGNTNYELWRFTAKADDQQIKIRWIKLSMIGTADYDALQNLGLYVDGTLVGSLVPLMNSDKTLVFDWNASPLFINSGVTRTFSLRGDILKGAGRNYYFQIQSGGDFLARDTGYDVGIKVNQSSVWSVFKAGGTTSINSGSLSVQKSASSPTGPLALSATGLVLASYDLKAVGEDIKLSTMTLNLNSSTSSATGFKNVKILIAGSQFGTTVSSLPFATNQDYSGSSIVKAGTTVNLQVVADTSSGTGTAVPVNATVTAVLVTGNANAQRQSAGTTFNVPSSNANGNTISLTSGTLAVTKNVSVANITSVKGATGIIIGSWLITAPSDQAVNVSSVTINNDASNTSNGLGGAFDVFTLWNGATQYGQTINSPSASTGTAQTFNFGSSLTVPAGQSLQLDLKANIITNADASWNGDASDDVSVTSINTTGAVTNSAVNYTTPSVRGQTINVLAAATLTLNNDVSPTMPDTAYFVAGDTGITLAAWKMSADNSEDVQVNRIQVREIGSSNNPGNVRNLKLYVGGLQVGSTIPAFTAGAPNAALFENTTNGLFAVPKNTTVGVYLRADMTPNTDAAFVQTGGADLQLRVNMATGTATATTNVSAKGKTSGAFVTLANNCSGSVNCDANSMKVVRTKPTFALVSPASTTLIPGEMEVFRFRVTAHSADDVVFTSGTSNIRFTVTSAGSAVASGFNFKLYDAATATQLGQTQAASGVVNGGTVDFNAWGSTVSKGTTKEYYILANLSSFSSTGNSFKIDIKNAAADFSWSDNSAATSDLNNANFVGVGLPLLGATFVKP